MSTVLDASASTAAPQSAPGWTAVAREEFRTAGLAVRGELRAIAVLMVVVTVVSLVVDDATGWDFLGMVVPMVVLALFAPLGVWKGAEPSRRSYFWALPVERGQHALARVLGGWGWLMALMGAYVLWVVGTNALGGSETGVGLSFLQAWLRFDLPPQSRIVEMTLGEHGWIWLVPFTAATVMYLVGSAVALSTDHPWRWMAGVFFVAFVVTQFAYEEGVPWLTGPIGTVMGGRYGLATVLTGIPGRVEWGWTAWAGATLLWTALGLAAVLAAAYRRRDV